MTQSITGFKEQDWELLVELDFTTVVWGTHCAIFSLFIDGLFRNDSICVCVFVCWNRVKVELQHIWNVYFVRIFIEYSSLLEFFTHFSTLISACWFSVRYSIWYRDTLYIEYLVYQIDYYTTLIWQILLITSHALNSFAKDCYVTFDVKFSVFANQNG